jgi:hypothetical protein
MASFLSNLFGSGAGGEAADKNRTAYSQYGAAGNGYLDTGLNNSATMLGYVKNDYAPLSALAGKYGQGTDMYMNSLGLNGQAGSDAATSAFQRGPGYGFQMDQGLDAINRRRAAGGMVNSGNADIDALKFGQGLADQSYGNWQQQLGGLNGQALSATGAAASGIAGADTNLANLYQSDAQNRVNLQGSVTSGMANANNQQAAAETQGARNGLGAIMGGLSLAAGGFGGGGFGGSAGSAIPGASGGTSYGGAGGPMPLTGGSWLRSLGGSFGF